MTSVKLNKSPEGFHLQVDSEEARASDWQAVGLGKGAVIATDSKSRSTVGRADPKIFLALISKLADMKFTGSISGHWEDTSKKMFFTKGKFVFATSNQIDDRLGEVIYRDGIISLDQLLDTAVLVTKEKKFGQLLIQNGVFDHTQLWNALTSQMVCIVRSFFIQTMISYEIVEGATSFIELPIAIDGHGFIEDVAVFSAMFKEFQLTFNGQSDVSILPDFLKRVQVQPGTFIHDFLTMINNEKKVEGLVKASRLSDTNTLIELFKLYKKGAVHIDGFSQRKPIGPGLSSIKNILDGYGMILPVLTRAYSVESLALPVDNARTALISIDHGEARFLDINDRMEITAPSIENLFALLHAFPERLERVEQVLMNFVYFTILSAIDSLSTEHVGQLKSTYKSIFK
jgi:hypothetical protein